MTPMKMKPRSRRKSKPTELVVMTPPNQQEIEQCELAAVVGPYAAFRRLVRQLSEDADKILERLQNGAEVEPGILTAEIEVRTDRGRYTEVLRINGHELLLAELPRVSS